MSGRTKKIKLLVRNKFIDPSLHIIYRLSSKSSDKMQTQLLGAILDRLATNHLHQKLLVWELQAFKNANLSTLLEVNGETIVAYNK